MSRARLARPWWVYLLQYLGLFLVIHDFGIQSGQATWNKKISYHLNRMWIRWLMKHNFSHHMNRMWMRWLIIFIILLVFPVFLFLPFHAVLIKLSMQVHFFIFLQQDDETWYRISKESLVANLQERFEGLVWSHKPSCIEHNYSLEWCISESQNFGTPVLRTK